MVIVINSVIGGFGWGTYCDWLLQLSNHMQVPDNTSRLQMDRMISEKIKKLLHRLHLKKL